MSQANELATEQVQQPNEPSTVPERESEYRKVLGDDLGPLYASLEDEYIWLEVKWQQFLTIFGSEDRVAIINEAAPAYFHMLEDVLSDDILMHIARLTDTGKGRLTVERLRPLARKGYPQIADLLAQAGTATGFVRTWRNKRLAHRELQVALSEGAKLLPPIDRDYIQSAIDAIHEIVVGVSTHFFGTTFDRDIAAAEGGAEALLYALRDGNAFRREELRRMTSGDPVDWDSEPLPP